MPWLLQSLPPNLSFTHYYSRTRSRPSSPPAHNSITTTTTTTQLVVVAASTKTINEDDYHSTLRALNSKGRFPRKSLGQDAHMAALVRERFASIDQVKVLQEDFTKCHIRSHLVSLLECKKSLDGESQHAKAMKHEHGHETQQFPKNGDMDTVVSNIPFNISTDVVKLLLPMGDIFSEVVLLLQEETALRWVESTLRTSEYRPINIFINFYSDPEYNFKVPRWNFFPQPNVDAAVVTFRLKQAADYPQVSSIKSFFSMVNSAFNSKRKMLRSTLQHICTSLEIEVALRNVGLPSTSRPEELTLDDFVRLHNLITKSHHYAMQLLILPTTYHFELGSDRRVQLEIIKSSIVNH
ncbi:ribosomal RNA small subunit methyltransferase, chloroplastic isoform X3 [Camellia sinensis]|uniref:ribosomal RNA small subunit methyltransferase, chloroplastic isoform X3 n=1 Tax=Camellia sinensis TaxID=4442 RepID=UPI001036C5D0|nr:ribosomal RNA small subunit methyltransferase, chloroplastic isoform X3 [Camellia sinensis]